MSFEQGTLEQGTFEQGTLEQGTWGIYMEDYFKINANPGSGGGSVKESALGRGKVPLIATTRRPLEEAISEVVREDGWPDVVWPDPSGRQYQLRPFSILLNE